MLCLAAMAMAAGCGSSGGSGAPASSPAASAREQAYHEMFEQTIPSIEAALPLAQRVDSTVVGHDGGEFHAIAWFSDQAPAALNEFLVEQGETTSVDHFYYTHGRLAAWTKQLHWLPTERGWPHRVSVRAMFGADGRVSDVHTLRDGRPWTMPPAYAATVLDVGGSANGMLEILRAKARRERR